MYNDIFFKFYIKYTFKCFNRLDLDTWINEPPSSSSASEDEELVNPNKLSDIFNVSQSNETKVYKELSPEEIQKVGKYFKRIV